MTRTTKAVAVPRSSKAAIQDFLNNNLTPELSRQQAALLLTSGELLRNVRELTPGDRTKLVEKIDQAYPTINSKNAKFVTALGNVSSAIEQLPTSAILSVGLKKRGNIAEDSGGTADIWRGEYRGTQVAIKAFRVSRNLKEAKEILWKRVPVWRRLSHENVLPFCGVDMTLFQLALVYHWEENGNINQYIASHPDASRPSLLFGVAKGLQYLHSLDIPHGDLKGANVVVDKGGRARLTEYGLASVNSSPIFTVLVTPEVAGTSRWLAPEIINPSRGNNGMLVLEAKPADVFAFAMLAVEIFTDKVPFEELKNEAVVPWILEGGRPKMPESARAVGLTGEMWQLLESCWRHNPETRPNMEEVVRRWQKFGEHNGGDDLTADRLRKPQPMAERVPGTARPRLTAEAVQPQAKPVVVHSRTDLGATRRRRTSEAAQPRTQPTDPPPTPKRRKKWFCGLF